jgi:phage N-6-adenine-methyltransferase
VNCEWYTPEYVLDKARTVLSSIDLDPASSNIAQERVKASTYFTKETNGLLHPWKGKVWCNPPYSPALIKKFTAKFLEEYENGNMTEGIMLTNAGTDTLWNLPLSKGVQVYTVGRISFIQPSGEEKGKGGRGQCFTYFGPNPRLFIDTFTKNNFCWVPNASLIKI